MDMQEICERRLEDKAEDYFKRYKSHMDSLSESILAKVHNGLNAGDVWALGRQLEQWEQYVAFCEDAGSTNLLGKIPNIAMDVITAVHGVSVIPILASVQPIDDEQGTVYFKNVRAETAKGNISAGESLINPRTGYKTEQGYASNLLESSFNLVGAQKDYTLALGQALRSGCIEIIVSDTVFGQDDGRGNIIGKGVSGIVDYVSGAVELNFLADPGAHVGGLLVRFQSNYELGADLPTISTFFDSTSVRARVYALKGTIGMLQSFGMRKRFGMVAEDEMSRDLVAEINKEIGGDIVRRLVSCAASIGSNTTTFHKTPQAGVSYFEHKQSWKDRLADAEAKLCGNAGRGTISVIVAGREQAAVISTLPGFNKLTDGNVLGVHVFGTIDGVTVVRCNEQAILDSKTAICMWKGATPFEAPIVYTPYMPLVVTATLPMPNPLSQQKAAAVWAGVQEVVPRFTTTLIMNTTDVAPM